MKTVQCTTQHEILVAFLWSEKDWIAEPYLAGRDTPYGFIGSAGHTRARELARNACPVYLKNKIERKRGKEIGLDPRFTYFRYKREPSVQDLLAASREAVAAFDAA